jgi:hypothetical protein
MALTGEQMEALQEAILSGFDRAGLCQTIRIRLEETVGHLAGRPVNRPDRRGGGAVQGGDQGAGARRLTSGSVRSQPKRPRAWGSQSDRGGTEPARENLENVIR